MSNKAMARNTLSPRDERALLIAHTDLVKRIAFHLAARLPSSVQIDDLTQAGMIGLIEAARNYDAAGGASFETYASIRIRGAMIDELRANDWAPRSVHKKVRDAAEVVRKLEQDKGRSVRETDIAHVLGITLDEYREVQLDASQCQMLSIDAESDDEDGGARQVADTLSISPVDHLQNQDFQRALAAAIKKLPEKDQLVLSLYYRDELNLREIGEVLSVSESRVCQIHGQALLRVRGHLSEWLVTSKGR